MGFSGSCHKVIQTLSRGVETELSQLTLKVSRCRHHHRFPRVHRRYPAYEVERVKQPDPAAGSVQPDAGPAIAWSGVAGSGCRPPKRRVEFLVPAPEEWRSEVLQRRSRPVTGAVGWSNGQWIRRGGTLHPTRFHFPERPNRADPKARSSGHAAFHPAAPAGERGPR